MVDKKGLIFGKISILDLAVIFIIIVMVLGLTQKSLSKDTAQIINANKEFYVTFVVEKVRDFSLNAVNDGDVFFEQYGQKMLGTTTEHYSEQAHEILRKNDGTAVVAPMEERYDLYIKLKCQGSISDKGYFVNGNHQLSPGNELKIRSNKVLTNAVVFEINE